jgi:ABC-type lipoprotein release transport system permease subunit
MALGASATAVQALVVRQAAAVAVAGALVGLLASLWASRWLEAFVFETSAQDPATLIWAVGALLAVTLLASYFPARRATSVDPGEVLRAE